MLSHRDLPTDLKMKIQALLAGDPDRSPERMLHLAEVLQIDLAAQWVKSIAHDYDANQAYSRMTYEASYYVLDAPIKGPTEKRIEVEASGVEVFVPVLPARHRVRVVDLPTFASEHGLNAEKLRQVGDGLIEEHKGWRRTVVIEGPLHMGQQYQPPRKPEPPLDESYRITQVRRTVRAAEVPPTTDYVPRQN